MMQRSILLAVSWGTLAVATISAVDLPAQKPPIDLPTQKLPVFGGSGGAAFSRDCGAGRVMTGLRGREGLLVDAVGLLCSPVNSDGTLGSETTVGTLAGGGNSGARVSRCPRGQVVIGARIYHGFFVDGISMVCRAWNAGARSFGPANNPASELLGQARGDNEFSICSSSRQPASGIRGRAGAVVDAIGFICDEP